MKLLLYTWALPTTCVGLVAVVLTLLTGGRARIIQGAIETWGGFSTFILTKCVPLQGGASAMTLGHVIIGQDIHCLDYARKHEHIHIRQVERWGPLFIPAYLLIALYLFCRGKNAYADHPFEIEAYAEESIG